MNGVRALPLAAWLLAAWCAFAGAAPAEEEPRVQEVAFAPADRLGPYRFAELVAVRPGDPLVPGLLERNLRLLRETGLFAAVAGEVAAGPAGPRVLFSLQPFPLVRDVTIRGNFLLLDRDLSAVVRLRAASPFREELVRGDIDRMLRHYEEKGFEGTTIVEEVKHGAGEVGVVYRVREGHPRVVADVIVRGAAAVGAERVREALGINRYAFFRGEDLQRGLERLREFYQGRGYLDVRVTGGVAPSTERVGFLPLLTGPVKGILSLGAGGYRAVVVTIDVTEGRRYEIVVRGATSFGEGDLRELLTFSRTGFFDEEEVAAGRARILAFYQERGFYLAEVDAQADYSAGRVVYSVREGLPLSVAAVRLRGFTHFAEGWVRERLETRPERGEEPSPLRALTLEADRRRIESWYRDAGFTRVEVPAPEVWPEAGPAGAEVTFAVREGPRSLVRNVSLAGGTALGPKALRAAAAVRPGDPFREALPRLVVDRVRAACVRGGFPGCSVEVRPDFSEDRAAVDLRVTVTEGHRQRLGAVVITGNGATRRGVILRELPLKPGDPLDPDALALAKLKLYDLGLFREVRYQLPEPVSPADPQDLIVAVRERETGFVGFGAGYSSDERFRGFVEAGEQNLFGTGRGLRWKSKLSTIGSRHDLFYQEPWLFGEKYKGQADLYYEQRDEEGYDLLRRGVTLGVNRELVPRLVLNLRYRYEFVNYTHVVPDLVARLGPLENLNIASFAATLAYDRRDNPILPRRGTFHLASAEMARPLFGGDTSFTKYQLETSWYLPFGERAELALGLRGGFTQLILGAGDLPLSERFFLGGDRTVRGYAYKSLGAKDAAGNPLGGNVFALGNAELRFTLRKKLRGVFFVDAGELWADQANLPASGVKAAAGAGLRYETLVGPIRLDWGHKLEREPGESSSRWHLTIGYPF
ncbi:MAG TPA: outer membrane protein assembly factor BamA [Candidatus Methanoperedens sp.]|nr:outer membrane protein assembly factor BamA [Candidatus Methanoperedens sp.]